MPRSDMDLIVHAAGPDEDLRLALEDLRIDRYLEAKRLLRATYGDWALRTSRSQVLAVGSANNKAIDQWYAEEPSDPDALMMRARVLTQRVLNAHRSGLSGQKLISAVDSARAACKAAADRWPADPVPYVCYLALAQTDVDERFPHHRVHWSPPPERMLPPGPWRVLDWVNERDPGNREAYHRMLGVFHARGRGGGLDFAQWVTTFAPAESPLNLLPLYAYVETYRLQLEHQQTASVIAYWSTADKAHYARKGLEVWFAHADPLSCSLLDLHYLAYALTATGVGRAGEVFEAIGPYMTTAPWALVTPNPQWWQSDFRSARSRALSITGGHR
ncbi:hypothetical protein OHT59_40400 [Streptomyces sp. NBC_00243]|uniref:hypothetical protein n=1 Tax=Streptomyces sp. NBC_00243 TaxID=2975688 RepID=UPI002DD7C231|nr:hypothetical protein [Streptomyces sp. NBC_00243]WRZ24336.1 hypothetical protein OHT59_40400 [Streptomyces sp. NBC_00243]